MTIHRHALRKQGKKTRLFGKYKSKSEATEKAHAIHGAKVKECKGGYVVMRKGSK